MKNVRPANLIDAGVQADYLAEAIGKKLGEIRRTGGRNVE